MHTKSHFKAGLLERNKVAKSNTNKEEKKRDAEEKYQDKSIPVPEHAKKEMDEVECKCSLDLRYNEI